MKPRILSIGSKLNLIVFAATATAMALASAALVYSAARGARAQAQSDLAALAKVIGNNSKAALLFNDAADGADTLAALASKPTVNAARLYNADGQPFAAYQRSGDFPVLPTSAPSNSEAWIEQGHLWMASPVEQDHQRIGTVLVAEDLAPFQTSLRRQIGLSALVTAAAAVLAMWLAARLMGVILRHVRQVVDVAQSVAVGILPEELPVVARDEIGELQAAFNQIVAASRSVVRQTQTVARGDYSISIQPRCDQDELSHALIEMTAKLKVFHEDGRKLSCVKNALGDLYDRMRGEPDLRPLLDSVLSVAVEHTGALSAALFLVRGPNQLDMAAGFAVDPPQDAPAMQQAANGLVAQVAAERSFRIVSGLENDVVALRTGLVESPLREIAFVPLVHDQVLVGVLEIGSEKGFRDEHQEFLRQAAPSIAIAIQSAHSRARLDELLAETRQQAYALQEKQFALKKSNLDLEERNSLLERQKQEIHRQKDELESAKLDLERKARELALASKYKSEFLANMSHELRTPLNSMLILSRLLVENKSGNLTPKQIEFAQTMHKAGSDLLTLINDILDLSNVEAGQMRLRLETTSILALAESICSIFKPIATDKGLAFSFEPLPGTPESIVTDGQRVGQILRNLLGNAFKFTPQGRISLQLRPASKEERESCNAAIAFAIEDTGIGIPPDKQRIVFHAFQQADGGTTRKFGGTGLGLTISRELALRLGGDILLRSEEGKGSTFTLLLPAHPSQAPLPVEMPPPPLLPLPSPNLSAFVDDRDRLDKEHRTLLVVDDDPVFNQIVAEFARERNFRILCAADGDEGIRLAETHRPYGILLDMMLPRTDGHAVLQKLKDSDATRTIPIFVLSALDHDQQMLRLGAVGFLTKPVSSPQLEGVFRRFEWIQSRAQKTLLVVDDDPAVILSVEDLLADWPVRVTSCATGADAIALSKTTELDAVLLDWGLNDMSGQEVIESLTQANPTAYTPIILYTGRDLVPDEEAAVRRKAVGVVVKGGQAPGRLLSKLAFYLHLVPPPQKPLPLPPSSATPPPAPAPTSLVGARILVADADMRNLYSLSSILEGMGAEILSASDGSKALAILQRQQPVHLVLIDVGLPGANGASAIRSIRGQASTQNVPIVALVPKALKDDLEAGLEAGANAVLPKPVDVDQLVLTAKAWIRK